MKRTTTGAAILGLIATMLTAVGIATTTTAHAFVDRDCSDFGTQRAAQIFFLNAGGPRSDPHRLDSDGDGIACETNPCPCYYGTTPPQQPQPGPGPRDPKPGQKKIIQHARIIKVTDGDTVKVRLARGGKRDVRLVGIDTPEVFGGTECWGPEASKYLKKKLPKGTKVKLISDPSQDLKDRYGRLLRYVIKKSNGRDMNRGQISKGNAKVYVYNNKPFNRVKGYKKAQAKAKRQDRGLWGSC